MPKNLVYVNKRTVVAMRIHEKRFSDNWYLRLSFAKTKQSTVVSDTKHIVVIGVKVLQKIGFIN